MHKLLFIIPILILSACSDSSSRSPTPDTTPPVVTAPDAVSVVATDSSGAAADVGAIDTFLGAASATDNIGVVGSISHDAPATFPIGTTTVTFTASDAAENVGSATSTVTVSEPPDTALPVVTAPDAATFPASGPGGSLASDANLVTFLDAASATDNVGVVGSITHDAPSNLPIGSTLITFSARDAAGNVGTDTATVTITDATEPVVTAPANMQTEATQALGTLASETVLVDFLAAATATDNVGVDGPITHDAPTEFPYGETLVTFTAVDAAGNQGSATATVHITMPATTHLVSSNNGNNGLELWRTDGTEEGTVMVKDINAGGDATPLYFLRVNTNVYFMANDGINGWELWISDGSEAGTRMVKDINPGDESSFPFYLTAIGDTVYFRAQDGQQGDELWKSDGTEAGTVMVEDIYPGNRGSDIRWITAFGDEVYFSASDDVHGAELWASDGTETGTRMVADINVGTNTTHSYPRDLTVYKDALYFAARHDDFGEELWATDGTSTGLVLDIDPGLDNGSPYGLTVLGDPDTGTLLFAARGSIDEGYELWQSDGTPTGTTILRDIKPFVSPTSSINGSQPSEFTVVGDVVYFTARDLHGSGARLWVSDGTAAGTNLVEDTAAGATYSDVTNISAIAGGVAFSAFGNTTGNELWFSDGTIAGTGMVLEIDPNNVYSPRPRSLHFDQYSKVRGVPPASLLPLRDGSGLMTIGTEDNGREMWKTDGTAQNTLLIKDVNPGIGHGTHLPAA